MASGIIIFIILVCIFLCVLIPLYCPLSELYSSAFFPSLIILFLIEITGANEPHSTEKGYTGQPKKDTSTRTLAIEQKWCVLSLLCKIVQWVMCGCWFLGHGKDAPGDMGAMATGCSTSECNYNYIKLRAEELGKWG